METGFRGTYVISWSQTEVDGQRAALPDRLSAGVAWRWSGEAMRLDGPTELLLLDGAKEVADLRRRAARSVRRLVGAVLQPKRAVVSDRIIEPGNEGWFVITDGRRTFTATMIETGAGAQPLVMFLDEIPPVQTDMWVVNCSLAEVAGDPLAGGIICFASGTEIRTVDGPIPVQDLSEGDMLLTKDDGPQEILWIGQRRMSGARLHVMPDLRPIRIRAGALCAGEPDTDLLVSPEHKLLVKGAAAEVLFNTPEVLVAAKDLVNDQTVLVDHSLQEVTYFHVMLDRHQVVWANGVETESFHPANVSLEVIEQSQRRRLFEVIPDLKQDPFTYGDFARRNLSPSEAELLKYDSALHH